MKKSYPCVPGSAALQGIFLFGLAFYIWMIIGSAQDGQEEAIPGFILFMIATLAFMVWSWSRSMSRVEILPDRVICKAPFCKSIEILYDKCNIGMDYHLQNGGKVWWIYLCYGNKPPYKSKNPSNRMNALKCRQGFIRIMFSEEVYDALMNVLPKRQKNGLIASRRVAGFDKQKRYYQ